MSSIQIGKRHANKGFFLNLNQTSRITSNEDVSPSPIYVSNGTRFTEQFIRVYTSSKAMSLTRSSDKLGQTRAIMLFILLASVAFNDDVFSFDKQNINKYVCCVIGRWNYK